MEHDYSNETINETLDTQGASQAFPAAEPVVQPDTGNRRKKEGKGAARVIALVLVCTLLGGLAGAGGAVLVVKGSAGVEETATAENSVLYEASRNVNLASQTVETGETYSSAEIYSMNVNSTVGITTSIVTNYWGMQTTSAASGSGFILTSDGYILTNYHVIEDSSSVTVTCYDNTAYPAEVIGYDESNDIAVLKIDAEGLTPVVLGDSDKLSVGDGVVAIGNPLGELTFSLTAGIISALDRSITVSSGVTMNLMQTDCAINSGNSGGALFNMYGEVIGITNAKYSSSSSSTASIDNVGFAIPINAVKGIVESIIEKGYISKPYIGVTITDVSTSYQQLGLPAGAAVYSVTEDGPAAEAGIMANDIITAVGERKIESTSDLKEVVAAANPGDKLSFTIYRQGETLELEVTIGEQIQSAIPETSTQTTASSDNGYGYGNGGNPFGGFFGGSGN